MYTAVTSFQQKENVLNRIALALLLLASPAFAIDAGFLASLNRLDPETRLEQICDLEAMSRIGKADRAKSDVVSHPIHSGNTLTANGVHKPSVAIVLIEPLFMPSHIAL